MDFTSSPRSVASERSASTAPTAGEVSASPDKSRAHRRWFFLTYAQCTIASKGEFEGYFAEAMERAGCPSATFYGCQKLHEDGGIHYHVLVSTGKQVNWSFKYARQQFAVETNECDSFNISVCRPKQPLAEFIRNHVNYCEKEGSTFGQRPSIAAERQEEKKRKWEEIGKQKSAVAKLAKLKEYFPQDYYKSFNSAKCAVDYEHEGEDRKPIFKLAEHIDAQRFAVPKVILNWEFDNLLCRPAGRAKSLLIVGDTRTGKTCMAQWIASRYGSFSEFDTEWDLNGYRPGHICAVLSDMKKGFPYWKGIFGCQQTITVHGRYQPTKSLKWGGVPSIIVANYEEDPRNWGDAVRSYIEGNSVIYEIPRGQSMIDNGKNGLAVGQLWGAPMER